MTQHKILISNFRSDKINSKTLVVNQRKVVDEKETIFNSRYCPLVEDDEESKKPHK